MRLRDRQLVVAGVWVMILGPCHCARTKLQWAGDSDGSCSSETAAQQWKMKALDSGSRTLCSGSFRPARLRHVVRLRGLGGVIGVADVEWIVRRVDIGEEGGSNRGEQSPKAC